MKRYSILLALLLCALLSGCCTEHQWQDATCSAPKTCTNCGKTEGEALPHVWQDATCTTVKACTVCGITNGEPASHNWQDALCGDGKTCTVCGLTEGTLTHTWQEATWTEPKTCTVCGAAEGPAKNFFSMNGLEVLPEIPDQFQSNGMLINQKKEENQEQAPLTYHNIRCDVVEELKDGSKKLNFAFDIDLTYKYGGPLGLNGLITDYNFFDLYSGEIIPINVLHMGDPLYLELDGETYEIKIEGTINDIEMTGKSKLDRGATVTPVTKSLAYSIVIPKDYDGLVLAVGSLKHYALNDPEWKQDLVEGMFANEFANYSDYYEDVAFYRIPTP